MLKLAHNINFTCAVRKKEIMSKTVLINMDTRELMSFAAFSALVT